MKTPLPLGLIGGSLRSAVGRTHHIAARMDDRWRIVCGSFSRSQQICRETGESLSLTPSAVFTDYRLMLEQFAGRLAAVCVLVPTPLHADVICQVLEAGIPVISEKSLAVSAAEVERIIAARDAAGVKLAVTFNYSGYPAIRELRQMIAEGRLGKLLHVAAEMPQEGFIRWVGRPFQLPQPQAWRLSDGSLPTVSLDLGVHLHHLIGFVTGERPLSVTASQYSRGHFTEVVDSVHAMARYSGSLSVDLWYGKCFLGSANGLRIRVFGTEGSVEWLQLQPEVLQVSDRCGRVQMLSRNSMDAEVCSQSRYSRFKAGHPDGFFEAFANYYCDLADWIQPGSDVDSPDVYDHIASAETALEGLLFLEAVAESARSGRWVEVERSYVY
ncbi:MAG: Gfo/Idh/MocA family protein [Planctomycetota bacterium]